MQNEELDFIYANVQIQLYNTNTKNKQMRKISLSLLMAIIATITLKAQVTVAGATVGNGTSYTTLKAAFDAINGGTQTSTDNIVVTIKSNTTETATAALNAGLWATLKIETDGVARTVTGNLALPLIDLNGADKVTIDGGLSKLLTISNTSTSSTSGTSTIRLQTDATNNTITNCNILGSATMTTGTNGGNIWIGANAGTAGNDNNTVSNCNIGPAGTNLPSKAVYFGGSSNTNPGTANSGNTITGNNIYDYFGAAVNSAGIEVNTGTVALTITNNKLYQTAPLTMTAVAVHTGIRINNTGGTNYIVNGNTIGYASNAGTGFYTINNLASTAITAQIYGITMSPLTTATGCEIKNNIISNMICGSAHTAGGANTTPFSGIQVDNGSAALEVSGNTVRNISNPFSGSSNSHMNGININGTHSNATGTNIINNTITNITRVNTGGNGEIRGIRLGAVANAVVTGNTISKLEINVGGSGSQIWGIVDVNSSVNSNISNNTIHTLNNDGTATMAGIYTGSATSVTRTINNNNIYGLTGAFVGNIFGIHVQAGTLANSTTISGNRIAALSGGASVINGVRSIPNASSVAVTIQKNLLYDFTSTNSTGAVHGIVSRTGTTTNIANNIIAELKAAPNATGDTAVNGISIIGGTTANIYYNTIALGKLAALTSSSTKFGVSGIVYNSATNTTLRNNIVWIDATPVGTGTIAAIRRSIVGVASTAPTSTAFNSNNNILYVSLDAGTAPVATNINKYLYVEGTAVGALTNGYGVDIGQADDIASNLKNDANFNSSCGLYKAFMTGRETATFTENNITFTSADTTYAPTGASFASGNATATTPAIADDYKNVMRGAMPDVGAIEFAGTGVDAAAPAIAFTALTNTVCLTSPIINATITDASGVDVSAGNKPRLYFKYVGDLDAFGSYPADNVSTFDGWKYVEATGTAPNFTFTFDYSLLTSVVGPGDQILYFIIAKDLAASPNVGTNAVQFPSSFCPTSVVLPAAAAPTTSPLNYSISITPTVKVVQPATTSVVQGATNVQVLRVDIAGESCIGDIDRLYFRNESTLPADVIRARVFYTTTPVFSTAVQFGSDVINPGAQFNILSAQASVTTGTNYFWLVYDLACNATVSNVLDAACEAVDVNIPGVPLLSAVFPENPGGTRTINALTGGDLIQLAPTATLGTATPNAYDITGKTVQVGEPSPIQNSQPLATNGATASNYGWTSPAAKTQWFKLVVPTSGYGSSGNLLIRATTPLAATVNDNQVALWKFPNMVAGTVCTDPANFMGGYLLAANNDGIATGTGYQGGPAATITNAIIRVRVTPGQTYYIQVDGNGAANSPAGDLIIEDLADAAGKNVSNNGFGNIHNPTAVDMRFASYEVVGDDSWTYYYNNNATETDVADDVVLMGLNWSTSTSYLWKGTNATGTDLSSHIRRGAKNPTAPSTTGLSAANGLDAFVVWSGRNSMDAASADLKPTAPYVPVAPNWFMMNKFWNVFPNVQPTTSIGVRYFYSDADFTALQTSVTGAGGALTNASSMEMIKMSKSATTHYTNAEIDPALGHAAILIGTVTSPTWANTAAVQTGINQAQYSITSFSGGGGGSTGSIFEVLPITISNLNATVTGNTNTVTWTTTSESNTAKFIVERSINGSNYTSIGEVATKAINGNSSSALSYSFVDANPVNGKQYYRLRMVALNASSKNSATVTVRRGAGKMEIVDVRPNPTNGVVYFNILSIGNNVNIAIRNLQGQTVIAKQLVQTNGFNVDLSALSSGMYILEATNVSTKEKAVFKLIKD